MVIRFMKSNDGDWVGMYLDGRLLDEGHSLRVDEALRLILGATADIKSVEVDMATYDYSCPARWPTAL